MRSMLRSRSLRSRPLGLKARSHYRRYQKQPPNALLYFLLFVFIFEEFVTVAYAKDYYEILGVSRDADSATIKRAFRKLAMKYHPDKNPGDKTAEKMYVELNNAYEVLGDENMRQRYDMFGEEGLKNGGGRSDDDDDFNPFGDMFGFGGRRRRGREERRVPDVIIPFSVTLETLYNGKVVEAVHRRRTICDSWSDCESQCPRCHGRGVIIQTRRLGPGFVQQIQTTCPQCNGKGKIGTPDCKSCPNGQFEQVQKSLLIDIEKGMRDGQFITFEGQTDEVPDHVNGDVKFQIIALPHPRFSRSGDDLHYTLPITLSEALVGVNRRVRQLDGRLVSICTDKVISPGEQIVISGEGMPSVKGGDPGDMVVEFWVDFPSNLTEEQKKAAIALHGDLPSLEQTGDGTETSHKVKDTSKSEL